MLKKNITLFLFCLIFGDLGTFLTLALSGEIITINSIDYKMVYIEPGNFMMGSPLDEPGRYKSEVLHKVTLTKGFYAGVTEVTQKQWKKIMGKNPSNFKSWFGKNDDYPVEQISWNDAQSFIKKLNKTEGKGKLRLPTEAEWEYVCRAGSKTSFAFGMCLSTDQANYNGNYPAINCDKGKYRETTLSVASFKPNSWGVYDMHGNVWEWCSDIYSDYSSKHMIDQKGGTSGGLRVYRGGGWLNKARLCRSAIRYSDSPAFKDHYLGLRLFKDKD